MKILSYLLLFTILIHYSYDCFPKNKGDGMNSMYKYIYHFSDQIAHAQEIGKALSPKKKSYSSLNGIVFAGMGGSGIAGEVVATTIKQELNIPVVTSKGYSLPNWANEKTLVILCSYSGNTEETVSCFHDAKKRSACIVGITTGGLLKDLLTEYGYDCIEVPGGMQPRAALGFLAIPLYYYLCKTSIIGVSILQSIDAMRELLGTVKDSFNKELATNNTYHIAKQLINRLPIIYGDVDITQVVATRWRAQLAENSKILASSHVLPEFNHNELEAFKTAQQPSNHAVIWLLDKAMHERNKKRYQICSQIIGRIVPMQIAVESKGVTLVERLFYLIYLGDWVSYWVASLQKTDPIIIPNISSLKEAMH